MAMRILVFGGSFDPVHRGHLALLKAADRALAPDRIVLVPSGRPPHKPGPAAPFKDRAALLRTALSQPDCRRLAQNCEISTVEESGRGPHYTYRTLRHLKSKYPKAEFWLLLGADQLASFESWRRPDEVRRLARLAFGSRVGAREPMAAGVAWVPGRFPDASSTKLRIALFADGRARRMAPKAVLEAIERRGLYGAGWRRWMRRALTPERYRHSLAVAALAGELAARNGLDAWKAAAAGLLHDVGRSMPAAAMARYVRERRLKVPALRETAAKAPLLLHAYVGVDLARRRLGVRDPEILRAIERHTLGAARMSGLDAVVYVADACSEDRRYAGAPKLRALARRDFQKAFAAAVEMKIEWVLKSAQWLHPSGPAMLRALKKRR